MQILIVDGDSSFRDAARASLAELDNSAVVDSANIVEGVELARRYRPDLVLIDVNSARASDGSIALLKKYLPEASVILLTAANSGKNSLDPAGVGAAGWLVKAIGAKRVIAAACITASARRDRVESLTEPKGALGKLSPRELEVLALASQGLTYKEIGARLGISDNTVKNYMCHILKKLHLRTCREAVLLAYSEGLVARAAARRVCEHSY